MTPIFSRYLSATLVLFASTIAFESNKLRATEGVDPPSDQSAKTLTENDYREFGRKLEEAAKKGEKASFDKLIRVVELLERSLGDLGLPEKDFKAVMAGAKSVKTDFTDLIIAEVKKGGSYTLLRTREFEGRRSALMRLIFEDGSVNYHEFVLHRSSDGQVVTEDIYIYLSCEMLSKTFRRMLLVFLADPKKGIAAQLKEADEFYLKNMNEVIKLSTAMKNGKNEEALAIFRKLPPELQKDKSLQILAIKAAQEGEESEYLIELERFRKAHPKDAAIDILSIDYFLLKKQYDEAQKAIDKLNESVGGDPFLQILKGGVLNQAGKNAEAKPIIEKALKDDPKLMLGYWTRVAIALEEKNYADTLVWLKKIEETGLSEIDLENIRKIDLYAGFVKSPEFEKLKKWLAERKK
jgi:tetratricopeptide (TPR) repeat protein